MIVADSNLIAYLFINGDNTATAIRMMNCDPEWAAPVLWRSEFRNIIATYLRRGEFGVEYGIELIEQAEKLMAGREHIVQSSRVLQLAAESGCTAYDCEFVAVAEHLGVPLITFDRAVLHAFSQIAIEPARFLASAR